MLLNASLEDLYAASQILDNEAYIELKASFLFTDNVKTVTLGGKKIGLLFAHELLNGTTYVHCCFFKHPRDLYQTSGNVVEYCKWLFSEKKSNKILCRFGKSRLISTILSMGGFVKEGVHRKEHYGKDAYYYGLLKEDIKWDSEADQPHHLLK